MLRSPPPFLSSLGSEPYPNRSLEPAAPALRLSPLSLRAPFVPHLGLGAVPPRVPPAFGTSPIPLSSPFLLAILRLPCPAKPERWGLGGGGPLFLQALRPLVSGLPPLLPPFGIVPSHFGSSFNPVRPIRRPCQILYPPYGLLRMTGCLAFHRLPGPLGHSSLYTRLCQALYAPWVPRPSSPWLTYSSQSPPPLIRVVVGAELEASSSPDPALGARPFCRKLNPTSSVTPYPSRDSHLGGSPAPHN